MYPGLVISLCINQYMIWKFYQEFVLNVEGSYHSNASISVALVSTVDVLCVESVNIRCTREKSKTKRIGKTKERES